MEKKKNREWVKNAAIIFLAVLLVLTFFSNTIMNRSLPEVATQGVTSGSIVARVRGTGTVTATGANQVKAEKNREIRSVLVKVGQKVEVGDVLFTLGQGTSEDIDAAEEKLRTLQSSYNRTAANAPIYDYSTEWRKLQIYKQKMDDAEEAMNQAKDRLAEKNYDPYNPEKNKQLEFIEDRLDTAIKARDKALNKYKEKLDDPSPDSVKSLKDKQAAIILKLVQNDDLEGDLLSDDYSDRSKIEIELQRVRTELSSTTIVDDSPSPSPSSSPLSSPSPSPSLSSSLSPQEQSSPIDAIAQIAVKDDDNADENNENEYQTDAIEADGNSNTGNKNSSDIDSTVVDSEEDISIVSPKSTSTSSQAKESSIVNPVEDKEQQEDKALLDQEKETNDYPRSPLTKDPSSQTKEQLEKWKERLTKALNEYDGYASDIYEKQIELDRLKAEYEAAEIEAQKWSDALETALDTGTAEAAVYRAKKAAYEAAKDEYDTAYENLAYSMASDSRSASVTGAELSDLNEQIERAKQKLEELTGEDQQITAKVAGTIQTIDTTAGSTVKKDDILCTIEVPDMGYTMSFSVTNDQANRLRPGDTATVSNFYWGNEVTATLNNIKVDPKNPQTNKLLTFDLTGNVTSGSELTISVGQKSANYDIIIPSSAIRTDANGSFVLRVDAKNSPLGNRYIAHRVQVEVLASDDSNSAVTGDLNNGDYVITTSNSPIKSGQMVRLATY